MLNETQGLGLLYWCVSSWSSGPLSASPLHRNYLPVDNSFEHRQLRNGKYMRFGRGGEQAWGERYLEEQSANKYDNRPVTLTEHRPSVDPSADRGTNENKRTGATEDIDKFMK